MSSVLISVESYSPNWMIRNCYENVFLVSSGVASWYVLESINFVPTARHCLPNIPYTSTHVYKVDGCLGLTFMTAINFFLARLLNLAAMSDLRSGV